MFNHLLFDWVASKRLDFSKYQFVFARFPLAHPGFLYFLRCAKRRNPSIKTLLEVPTWPYKLEHKNMLRKMQYSLDHFCQKYLRNYVDRVVHYGEFQALFGVPGLGIRNGVDTDEITLAKCNSTTGKIRLLATGNWNFWHGLDRLLLALAVQPEHAHHFHLTIVGGGREIPNYKNIVSKHKLEELVTFLPACIGTDLDKLFDQADICIGCLGMFRKNVVLDSSLKHREYAARGLPFILTTPDPDFPDTLAWVKYFPAAEGAIDLAQLYMYWQNLSKNMDLRQEIRTYAVKNLDWSCKLGEMLSKNGL
ncbi:MAG: glycosyltransferase [Saprospiraceae bacterium]|nr:glycosyltransferase [Saprospiraceae bacterium]